MAKDEELNLEEKVDKLRNITAIKFIPRLKKMIEIYFKFDDFIEN